MAKVNRKDWRELPLSDWNTLSFTEFFRDMNAELYGVDTYLPLRNWKFEQAQIKRAIDAYGPELLRQAFDECFRDYRPTREYPILTAGFCVSYRINTVIPRLLAEQAAKERVEDAVTNGGKTADELAAWL
jgi:hypothetical protein